MISLLDVNVLVALAWSTHTYHLAAHRWFSANAHVGWASCLFTQAGFLRVSMNPLVSGVAIDCDFALHALEGLTKLPHHQYVSTLPELSLVSFAALTPHIRGHRQVTDAVLLYIAHSHGMKLVTFDKGISNICPWPTSIEICPT